MRKKVYRSTMLVTICLGVAAGTAASTLCQADNQLWSGDYSRKGKWDLYVSGQYLGGDTATFPDTGLSLTLDGTFTGGAGFGYHLLDYLSIDVDLYGGAVRFTGRDVYSPTTITRDATLFGGNVNLNYNVLRKRLTPVITGGAGFMNFNGSGFSETDPSLNIGAGLRWDITTGFLSR